MKKICTVLILVFIASWVFAEKTLIDWQGRDMGQEEFPVWLEKLVSKGDERAARKQFGVAGEKRLLLCSETAASLEMARQGAKAKARQHVTGSEDVRTIRGFSEVAEFLQQFDEDGKTTFTVYKLFQVQE